ncbi:hypothetical protein VC218_03975 [Xanthomonas nasturtii]|nr:hypothetical protein [Xanthomonas nasturtii]MEA9578106.1 hypothetical protein [Xanthomonas nasturtii]
MTRKNMHGSVPNVRRAKAIHETKQATRNARASKLKKRAAATKPGH